MGLLDDLLAGLASQQGAGPSQQPADPSLGRRTRRPQPQAQPGGSNMTKLMMALLPVVLAMLANRRASGPQAGSDPRGAGAGGGGGGLADLISVVLGGRGSGAGSGGGLGELLSQLQRAGFGTQADSWVSRGQNLPLPPEALEQIFGRQGVEEIARHVGASEADTRRALSELLPEVVDRVTPQGQVPDLDALSHSVDELTRRSRRY